jgi:hypothetical protein
MEKRVKPKNYQDMKASFKIIFATIVMCSLCSYVNAQTLKDLLKKATGSSLVQDVVESVTGVSLQADIKGTWDYSGVAVKLVSEDLLKNAAAGVAAGQIEDKLDGYVQKVGIKPGAFGFIFSEDNTFTTTFKGKNIPGTYTLDEQTKTLTLTYGKTSFMKGFTMTASVNITSSQLDLMFNADKLLDFIGKVSSSSSNSTLAAISAIAQQYDGMKLGFELKK